MISQQLFLHVDGKRESSACYILEFMLHHLGRLLVGGHANILFCLSVIVRTFVFGTGVGNMWRLIDKIRIFYKISNIRATHTIEM